MSAVTSDPTDAVSASETAGMAPPPPEAEGTAAAPADESGKPPIELPTPEQLKDMAALAMYCPACACHFRSKSAYFAPEDEALHTYPITNMPCGHMVCHLCDEEVNKCEPPKKCLVCQKEVTSTLDNLQYGDFAEIQYNVARTEGKIAHIKPEEPSPECTDCEAMGTINDSGFWLCSCDASKKLCQAHSETHTKLGHTIAVSRVVVSPYLCPKTGDRLSLFCATCATSSCQACVDKAKAEEEERKQMGEEKPFDPDACKAHRLERMKLLKRVKDSEMNGMITAYFKIGEPVE